MARGKWKQAWEHAKIIPPSRSVEFEILCAMLETSLHGPIPTKPNAVSGVTYQRQVARIGNFASATVSKVASQLIKTQVFQSYFDTEDIKWRGIGFFTRNIIEALDKELEIRLQRAEEIKLSSLKRLEFCKLNILKELLDKLQ